MSNSLKIPIFFLSDLHLSPHSPRTFAAFRAFILGPALQQAKTVIILGDLFEYWIGGDLLSQNARWLEQITQLLSTLAEQGIQLLIMPGNRDFLLEAEFFRLAKAEKLPDPFILEIVEETAEDETKKIVLTHGDKLVSEWNYLCFRWLTRIPWIQNIFLSLPYRYRQAFALWLRNKNIPKNTLPYSKGKRRIDINKKALQHLLKKADIRLIIHGHTHQPAHYLEPYERWVLSDWDLDCANPHATYLALNQAKFSVHQFNEFFNIHNE